MDKHVKSSIYWVLISSCGYILMIFLHPGTFFKIETFPQCTPYTYTVIIKGSKCVQRASLYSGAQLLWTFLGHSLVNKWAVTSCKLTFFRGSVFLFLNCAFCSTVTRGTNAPGWRISLALASSQWSITESVSLGHSRESSWKRKCETEERGLGSDLFLYL